MKSFWMKRTFVWALFAVSFLTGMGFFGERAVSATEAPALHIVKRVADWDEFIAVQGGVLARANPDGTRVIVACTEADQRTTFINEERGVFWQGPLEQFYDDLHLFVIVHLLPDEPGLLYAVQVLVEEIGEDVVAGRVSRHFLVQWRPSAEEGGDGMDWEPLQELWIDPQLSESLTASGCFQAALALEMLQLGQSTFSTQRFYGLMTNDDYVPLLLQGFPVRAKFYVPGSEPGFEPKSGPGSEPKSGPGSEPKSGPGSEPKSDEYVAAEVVRVDDSPPAALFEVPDGLRPVDSPREVF